MHANVCVQLYACNCMHATLHTGLRTVHSSSAFCPSSFAVFHKAEEPFLANPHLNPQVLISTEHEERKRNRNSSTKPEFLPLQSPRRKPLSRCRSAGRCREASRLRNSIFFSLVFPCELRADPSAQGAYSALVCRFPHSPTNKSLLRLNYIVYEIRERVRAAHATQLRVFFKPPNRMQLPTRV